MIINAYLEDPENWPNHWTVALVTLTHETVITVVANFRIQAIDRAMKFLSRK